MVSNSDLAVNSIQVKANRARAYTQFLPDLCECEAIRNQSNDSDLPIRQMHVFHLRGRQHPYGSDGGGGSGAGRQHPYLARFRSRHICESGVALAVTSKAKAINGFKFFLLLFQKFLTNQIATITINQIKTIEIARQHFIVAYETCCTNRPVESFPRRSRTSNVVDNECNHHNDLCPW